MTRYSFTFFFLFRARIFFSLPHTIKEKHCTDTLNTQCKNNKNFTKNVQKCMIFFYFLLLFFHMKIKFWWWFLFSHRKKIWWNLFSNCNKVWTKTKGRIVLWLWRDPGQENTAPIRPRAKFSRAKRFWLLRGDRGATPQTSNQGRVSPLSVCSSWSCL